MKTDNIIELVLHVCAQRLAEERPLLSFARELAKPDWAELLLNQRRARRYLAWQGSELQRFFLNGVYQELTGSRAVNSDEELAQVFVTPDAEDYLQQNCLNPFWFWSVLNAAVQSNRSLPVTLSDVENGVKALFEQLNEGLRFHHISGWPSGYSGHYTPWHIRDAFKRSTLWNNDSTREVGLALGLLLVGRAQRSRVEQLLFGRNDYAVHFILNPLFDVLASVAPR